MPGKEDFFLIMIITALRANLGVSKSNLSDVLDKVQIKITESIW